MTTSLVKRDTSDADKFYYYFDDGLINPTDRKTRLLDPKYCKHGEPTETDTCNTQPCPSE